MISRTSQRFNALDNLRSLLALLGIPYHVVFFLFNGEMLSEGIQRFWQAHHLSITLHQHHAIFFFVMNYIHVFRMPTFFLLAGFFAHYIYEKKSALYFLKNRLVRVGLPFCFYFVCLIPLFLLKVWVYAEQHHQSFYAVFSEYFRNGILWADVDHLLNYWFLYYLIIFYGATLFFIGLKKIRIISEKWVVTGNVIAERLLATRMVYVVMFLLGYLIFVKMHYWYTMLDETLTPSFGLVFFYMLWFFLGWYVWRHQKAFQCYKQFAWQQLVLSMGCYGVYLVFYFHFAGNDYSLGYFTTLIFYFLTMVFSVFGCLGFVWCYLPKEEGVLQKMLRYLSGASYWFYLTQLVICAFFVAMIQSVTTQFYMQFLGATTLSFVVCVVSYHVIVRRTWLSKIVG